MPQIKKGTCKNPGLVAVMAHFVIDELTAYTENTPDGLTVAYMCGYEKGKEEPDPSRITVDGNEMSVAVYCADKYGARQAQEKTRRRKVSNNKPSWSSVPEGYDWMAQDEDGKWYAYDHEPTLPREWDARLQWLSNSFKGYQWKELNSCSAALIPNPHWKDTLERRPYSMGVVSLGDRLVRASDDAYIGIALNASDESGTVDISLPCGIFYISGGTKMNSNTCPTVKTLEPLERIHAKGDRLKNEMDALNKRLNDLEDIENPVNWKNATEEIKFKAVKAADNV
jgi:hypothetical protein